MPSAEKLDLQKRTTAAVAGAFERQTLSPKNLPFAASVKGGLKARESELAREHLPRDQSAPVAAVSHARDRQNPDTNTKF